jgi:NAD(P)-dependent dehydrogenase (short-subunit alcohol dehydrogenase family)
MLGGGCRPALPGRFRLSSQRGIDYDVARPFEVMAIDLSSLESIASFSRALAQKHPRVDVLMNNAGVMVFKSARHTPTCFTLAARVVRTHVGARPPKKRWRAKVSATPNWYKARAGLRTKALSGAARVARFRPPKANS